MWIGEIRLDVRTADVKHAGTNDVMRVGVRRDGAELFRLKLDYAGENDLERGASRTYRFSVNDHFFDETEPLPDGIGQWPPPYPGAGLELSNGVNGHLVLRLLPSGIDAWRKDHVTVRIREWVRVPDGFDAWTWQLSSSWQTLGDYPRDVWISRDSGEGFTAWDLVV